MARATRTEWTEPVEVPLNELTVEGGGTALEAIKKGVAQPTAPSLAKFLKSGVLGKKVRVTCAGPTLAAGESLVGAKVWIYSKCSTAANDLEYGRIEGLGTALSNTAAEWHSESVSAGVLQTAKKREESVLTVFAKIIKGSGPTSSVYAFGIEWEIKTETSAFVGASGQFAGKATAGVVALPVTEKPTDTGNTWLLRVATAGEKGPTAVSDSTGQTWVKDAENHNGTSECVQVWRAEAKTTPTEVKLEGLTSTQQCCAQLDEFRPLTISGQPDQTAASTGTTKNVACGPTGAIRATQGDLAVCAFAGLNSTEGTGSFGNITAGWTPQGAVFVKETPGLEMGPGYNETPAEGTTLSITAELVGLKSEGATWAGVLVAYKVLADTGGAVTLAAQASKPKAAGSLATTAPARVAGTAQPKASGVLAATAPARLSGVSQPKAAGSLVATAPAKLAGTAGARGAASLAAHAPTALAASPSQPHAAASLAAHVPTTLAAQAARASAQASAIPKAPARLLAGVAGARGAASASLSAVSRLLAGTATARGGASVALRAAATLLANVARATASASAEPRGTVIPAPENRPRPGRFGREVGGQIGFGRGVGGRITSLVGRVGRISDR